jgi:hypothetical protein
MRLLSPESVTAIIGVMWCAKVLDSFPSDWSNFHESQETSDRAIQILVWISGIIADGARELEAALGHLFEAAC